jgi:ribose transport system permease protein
MTARRLVNQEATLVVVIVIASVAFWLAAPKYLGSANIVAVLASASTTAVIGFAQLTCLSVGEMSLAVGGIGAAVTVLGGMLLDTEHMALLPVVVICLIGGLAAGLVNGVVTATTNLSGFIVTLATGGAFAGVAIGVTQSNPYPNVPSALATFGQGHWGFVPYLAVAPAVCAVLLYVLYRWLRKGRELLAVGGNRDAATLAGISAPRATIWAHTLSGLLAAVAAVMYMGVLRQSVPTIGSDWLVSSFAVPIIGGTLLAGGEVSIGGAVLAAILLSVISDGLVLVNVSQYIVEMVEGILTLAAVLANSLRLAANGMSRPGRRPRVTGGASDRRATA